MQAFGPAYYISPYPHAMELLKKWSVAAIRGEPLEYLYQVWRDVTRLVYPNRQTYGGLSPEELVGFMLYGVNMHSGSNEFVTSWQGRVYPNDPAPYRGAIGPLRTWDGLTRLEGAWTLVLLALCLAGPWVLSGRARAGMILFASAALALLLFPILVKAYDYRFVIPGYAPLVAAGRPVGVGSGGQGQIEAAGPPPWRGGRSWLSAAALGARSRGAIAGRSRAWPAGLCKQPLMEV